MKKATICAALAATITIGFGGAVSAGEYNGKGEPVPGGVNGRSECSYSGRDVDDAVEGNPPGFDDDAIAIRGAQSYGQYVSQGLKGVVPSPGQACRGNG